MSEDQPSLARRFGHAARVRHSTSQQKAHQAFRELSPLLPDATRAALRTAWDHFLLNEGAAELDGLVANLVARGL